MQKDFLGELHQIPGRSKFLRFTQGYTLGIFRKFGQKIENEGKLSESRLNVFRTSRKTFQVSILKNFFGRDF